MSSNASSASAASRRAVTFDTARNYDAAIYFYKEASKFLYLAVIGNEGSDEEKSDWRDKIKEYDKRAVTLKETVDTNNKSNAQSLNQQAFQRCNFLFGQALDADEKGFCAIAIDLYGQTAEYALNMKNQIDDPSVKTKVLERAEQAISRAEDLKFKDGTSKPKPVDNSSTSPSADVFNEDPIAGPEPSNRKGSGYTAEEKVVLSNTSIINGLKYVPFMDIDLNERFRYALAFTDPDGLLKLSPKQRAEVSGWVRPSELHASPRMIQSSGPDFHCIKQTIVSDCSFVASLAVSAQYEKRFSKKIITPIIFPRNRSKEPIYNPFGKYMIKLHINGVPRKVIIDDQLPVDRYGHLLCSYSTQKDELWVSLLEKAYMKVMGGYDFPGSNSNIDLYALTGWIPERVAIKNDEPDFNADNVFNMLELRLSNGHCLGTVATGFLSAQQEERTGLVPTHAYAILNVRTVNGVKLMQLKNPWSHVRWRGNYSELDVVHWTPTMKETLKFDPDSAASFDNGIFWIDYDSILHFFDVFYINWSPEIFPYTYCIHQQWMAGQGPARDSYNMGENPQFKLHIPGSQSGSVWVHLIRHITDVEDFKNNKEFITVLVYKTNGSRVYYPRDPPPYIDGVRINSPHYLCKVVLEKGCARTFTLVISQYEKSTNIYYTLRAYSTLPFKLGKIITNYKYSKEISGQWKGESAGGCTNHPQTYPNNPSYHLQISAQGLHNLLLDLKGPKQYPVGFSIKAIDEKNSEFGRKTSEPYRSGFVVLEVDGVGPGTYSITPTTYYPGQEAPFFLTVKSTCPINLTKVK